MQAQEIEVHRAGLTLRGLVWRPSGRGPFPAVLYNHGSGPALDMGRPALLGPAFARQGYLLLYLFRRGAGLSADQGIDSETQMDQALRERGQPGRNELQLLLLEDELGDALGGLEFLRAQPDVDGGRIAAVGYSFGGSLTLLLAERDAGLRAACVFSPAGNSWDGSPELRARLLAAVARSRAPIFFIFAANDYAVAPGQALAAEMARLGKPHRLQIYPPTGNTPAEGHDFVHRELDTWSPDVFAFLEECLR